MAQINADEKTITMKLISKLHNAGYKVLSNIIVDGLELDVVAIGSEENCVRPLVYVYEVKSKPKPKLVKQMIKRMPIADYLYAVVPFNLYPWILKKLNEHVGLVIYVNDDLYIFKKAEYLGNGMKVLSMLTPNSVSQ